MFKVGNIVKINPLNKNMYNFVKDEERFKVFKTHYEDISTPVVRVHSVYSDYSKGIPNRVNFYIYADYFILEPEQKQIKEIDLKDFEELYV